MSETSTGEPVAAQGQPVGTVGRERVPHLVHRAVLDRRPVELHQLVVLADARHCRRAIGHHVADDRALPVEGEDQARPIVERERRLERGPRLEDHLLVRIVDEGPAALEDGCADGAVGKPAAEEPFRSRQLPRRLARPVAGP